jgi:hypothetical protein
MGLKLGLVNLSAQYSLYFPIKTKKGSAYSYAKPYLIEGEDHKVVLRFLDGSLGYLVWNDNFQFEVSMLETKVDWVPTEIQTLAMRGKSIPREMVIFGGDCAISEIFPKKSKPLAERRVRISPEYLNFSKIDRRVSEVAVDPDLPPEKNKTLSERFEHPEGPWDKVVANCLRAGGALEL